MSGDLKVGDQILISGQFRSYNNYSDEGSRLILTIFARTCRFLRI